MVYFWTENSGSGFKFWKRFCELLYGSQVEVVPKDGANKIYPELVSLVSDNNFIRNKFVILMDRAYDNNSVMDDYFKVSKIVKRNKDNLYLAKFISFESILFEFSRLEEYLGLQINLENKKLELSTRSSLLSAISYGVEYPVDTLDFVIDYKNRISKKGSYSVESLISSILGRLTKGSGYEISKGSLGLCWLESCCVIEGDTCSRDSILDYNKTLELRDDYCLNKGLLNIERWCGINVKGLR